MQQPRLASLFVSVAAFITGCSAQLRPLPDQQITTRFPYTLDVKAARVMPSVVKVEGGVREDSSLKFVLRCGYSIQGAEIIPGGNGELMLLNTRERIMDFSFSAARGGVVMMRPDLERAGRILVQQEANYVVTARNCKAGNGVFSDCYPIKAFASPQAVITMEVTLKELCMGALHHAIAAAKRSRPQLCPVPVRAQSPSI